MGFNEELLTNLLLSIGFCNITRVSAFNLGFYDKKNNYKYYDTSEKIYKNYFISLNLVAKVCPDSKLLDMKYYDGFEINHNALPYFGYKLLKGTAASSASSSASASSSFASWKNEKEKKKKQLSKGLLDDYDDENARKYQSSLTLEQLEFIRNYFQNHRKD
jgi:hypothetical protein